MIRVMIPVTGFLSLPILTCGDKRLGDRRKSFEHVGRCWKASSGCPKDDLIV